MSAAAAVSWFCRTQKKCVALSGSETGYVALGDAVTNAFFL